MTGVNYPILLTCRKVARFPKRISYLSVSVENTCRKRHFFWKLRMYIPWHRGKNSLIALQCTISTPVS